MRTAILFALAFASAALAAPVDNANATPETSSKPTLPPGFTCGCITECMLSCPDIRLCLCPPDETCIPKYLCPTKTLPTRIPPTTTKKPTITVHPKPTKTATITIPRPRPTCGPCLNDCIVNCPDGALCKCPHFCDPKYFCPKSARSTEPIIVEPPPKCGDCLNDCIVNCKNPNGCNCLQYCDPKYFCVKAARSITKVEIPKPVPSEITSPKCGDCLNDCIVNCKNPRGCICPAHCDPKYKCPNVKGRDIVITRKLTLAPAPTKALPTLLPPQPTCGTCTNACKLNCPPGKRCICPDYCDPAYRCLM